MESFKGESIINFFDTFKTDLDCLEYLAAIKWKGNFDVQNVITINLRFVN